MLELFPVFLAFLVTGAVIAFFGMWAALMAFRRLYLVSFVCEQRILSERVAVLEDAARAWGWRPQAAADQMGDTVEIRGR